MNQSDLVELHQHGYNDVSFNAQREGASCSQCDRPIEIGQRVNATMRNGVPQFRHATCKVKVFAAWA